MRVLRTRLLGLLSVIVLAIPATAFAQPGYLCRITGQISSSCCCAKKCISEHCQAAVDQQSCCQLIQAEYTVAPSGTHDATRMIAAPVPATTVASLPSPSSRWTWPPRLVRVAHPPGPPRFLVKCSLLI